MLLRSDSRVTFRISTPIDGHAPFIRHIEPEDQIEQRAFAGAAGADDGDALADLELETEIVENRRLASLILNVTRVEGDVIGDARQIGAPGRSALGSAHPAVPECGAPPLPTGSIPG